METNQDSLEQLDNMIQQRCSDIQDLQDCLLLQMQTIKGHQFKIRQKRDQLSLVLQEVKKLKREQSMLKAVIIQFIKQRGVQGKQSEVFCLKQELKEKQKKIKELQDQLYCSSNQKKFQNLNEQVFKAMENKIHQNQLLIIALHSQISNLNLQGNEDKAKFNQLNILHQEEVQKNNSLQKLLQESQSLQRQLSAQLQRCSHQLITKNDRFKMLAPVQSQQSSVKSVKRNVLNDILQDSFNKKLTPIWKKVIQQQGKSPKPDRGKENAFSKATNCKSKQLNYSNSQEKIQKIRSNNVSRQRQSRQSKKSAIGNGKSPKQSQIQASQLYKRLIRKESTYERLIDNVLRTKQVRRKSNNVIQ